MEFYPRRPPLPYLNWTEFFNEAPANTKIMFAGESWYWLANGNTQWVSSDKGIYKSAGHLCNFTFKGVYVSYSLLDAPSTTKESVSLTQLIALEAWFNQQLEEAYERGVKDGAKEFYERYGKNEAEAEAKGYDRGYTAGFNVGHRDGYGSGWYDQLLGEEYLYPEDNPDQ